MPNKLSLIDSSVEILLHEKQPVDIFDLFDRVTKDVEIDEDHRAEIMSKFYTDLTTSAKFVYVGDNKWNLKANEKIELWEKDGSFYKEYTVIELPDEYKEPERVVKKKTPIVVAKPEVVEEVVEETPVTPEPVVVEETPVIEEPVQEPVVEPVAAPEFQEVEEYEEEIFDDYDDFDEDKYNEYMDSYEDQYDD